MARTRTGESSLARAVRIVESFRYGEPALTITEIAERSRLPAPTVSRLVAGLVDCGWLEREGRDVRVGVRLWEIGSRASPTLSLRQAARPFMQDLQAVVGQHTQLVVFEGSDVLIVERLSARDAAVNYSLIAGRLPVYASSSGLVLLAHAPVEEQERIMAMPMRAYTEHGIRTPGALRSALAQVRERGYALCAGHIHPATTGIAVPVRGPGTRVVAALSLIVPNDDAAYSYIPMLMAAARGVSRSLGGPAESG